MMIVVVVDDVGGDDGDDLDLAPHHISTPKLCENDVYYIFYLNRDVRTFAAQLRIRTSQAILHIRAHTCQFDTWSNQHMYMYMRKCCHKSTYIYRTTYKS